MQTRLHAYHSYLWSQLQGFNEDEFFRKLPFALQSELRLFFGQRGVRAVSFLSGLVDHVVAAIALVLEPEVFSAGDGVVLTGASVRPLRLPPRDANLKCSNTRLKCGDTNLKCVRRYPSSFWSHVAALYNWRRV